MSLHLQQLSPHLFWDVDIDKVEIDQHAKFIIRRVTDRGTLTDVKALFH